MRELNIENKITISETDFKNAISIARFLAGVLQNIDTNKMLEASEIDIIQRFCCVVDDNKFSTAIDKILEYYKEKQKGE